MGRRNSLGPRTLVHWSPGRASGDDHFEWRVSERPGWLPGTSLATPNPKVTAPRPAILLSPPAAAGRVLRPRAAGADEAGAAGKLREDAGGPHFRSRPCNHWILCPAQTSRRAAAHGSPRRPFPFSSSPYLLWTQSHFARSAQARCSAAPAWPLPLAGAASQCRARLGVAPPSQGRKAGTRDRWPPPSKNQPPRPCLVRVPHQLHPLCSRPLRPETHSSSVASAAPLAGRGGRGTGRKPEAGTKETAWSGAARGLGGAGTQQRSAWCLSFLFC